MSGLIGSPSAEGRTAGHSVNTACSGERASINCCDATGGGTRNAMRRAGTGFVGERAGDGGMLMLIMAGGSLRARASGGARRCRVLDDGGLDHRPVEDALDRHGRPL